MLMLFLILLVVEVGKKNIFFAPSAMCIKSFSFVFVGGRHASSGRLQ
jgi:hypothetical protein